MDRSDDKRDDKTHSYTVLTGGTMVSHYRIVEKIGAGGMGEVYRAEDTRLNRDTALKFLPANLIPNEDAKSRFTREAQAAASLKHPNIVTIYEVSEYEGRPFIAMECCEGKPLKNVINEKKLSLDKIIELTIQICEGLQEAHESGIVHRDIKPSNIILDKKGRPKIADFGLATFQGADKLTKTGSTLGTMGYMSPEQIQVLEPDHRADLFSLGVVLYEMIAGRLPFKGDTEAATLNSLLNDMPEPLSRYKSGVSGDLQRIVSKLLEKKPEMRYQGAADLITDLRRLDRGGGISADTKRSPRFRVWMPVSAILVLLTVVVIIIIMNPAIKNPESRQADRKMLAVLPFENMGSPDDEYFADGITQEITSRLCSVEGLGVISRNSVIDYKNTDLGLQEIARELGVGYILDGSVRWDKTGDTSRVRITPQLIRVSDNIHLWADNFERPLTRIFDLQAEIATRIVEALDITLLEPERRRLEARQTGNMEAYNYFLQGADYSWRNYEERECLIAIDLFNKAIELDNQFAEAYAGLAGAHLILYWFGHDPTEERLQLGKDAIDKALEINSESIGAHEALAGYYYWGLRDLELALQEAEELRQRRPSSEFVYAVIAAINRRQGKWDEALKGFARRVELNPREAVGHYEHGYTSMLMRNYDEAEAQFNMAISLAPDLTLAHEWKSKLYLLRDGDVEGARRVLAQAGGKADDATIEFLLAECDIYDRDYDEALNRLSTMIYPVFDDSGTYYMTMANIYSRVNAVSRAAAHYDSLVMFCLEKHIEPYQFWQGMRLAAAYAGLGRKEKAISLSQKVRSQVPVDEDALTGPDILLIAAEVDVIAGEYDNAVEKLDTLLSMPSAISVPLLQLDPRWEPLRDHPGFIALMDRYE